MSTTSPRATTNMPLSSPTVFLDYNRCTPTELGTFIKNRSSLKPSDSEELAHFHKSHLIARLDMLDKYLRFRFLDLPPELRLEVYKYILISRNCEAPGAEDQVIETSLLRTCKLVYEEAAPVLYGENEFTVEIIFPPNSWSGSRNSWHTCSLGDDCYHSGRHCIKMTRLGLPNTNFHSRGFPTNRPLTIHMASCPCFNVLRQVRHLTMFVSSGALGASRVFAILCTMLSGASKLAKLTIVLGEQWRTRFNIKGLAATLWSVALLRSDVQLEVQSEDKAVEAKLTEGYDTLYETLEQYRDLLRKERYHGLEAPGDLISKARNQEARLSKEDREDWRYLRHVETILDELLHRLGVANTVDAFYIPIEAWANLQSYVNEDSQSLRSLNEAWKDSRPKDAPLWTSSFPLWYKHYGGYWSRRALR